VPTRTRAHNALFLAWDDLGVLFDPGEGTQRQMTLAGLAPTRVTHIVLTHFHGDHCLGLPGVIQRLSLDRVPHTVEVIYPESGQVYFDRLRQASLFAGGVQLLPRPLRLAAGEVKEVARWEKVRLLAGAVEHGVDCYGYRLQEDDGRRMVPELLEQAGVRGPAIGELQRRGEVSIDGRSIKVEDVSVPRPGQAFALVLDTRPCPAAEQLARNADLLVCEATYLSSETQEAFDHHHMTAAQAAELARNANVRRLALTHFSQRYITLEEHHREASAVHPDVFVAEDLSRVAVPPRVG
jgi:ribonuclease Z